MKAAAKRNKHKEINAKDDSVEELIEEVIFTTMKLTIPNKNAV